MAHIEMNEFPVHRQHDIIFHANLTLAPTIKNTIIKTIKDGGDKQNRGSNVKACMTDWNMQAEPGFAELEKEIAGIINYLPTLPPYRMINNVGTSTEHMIITSMWGMLYKKNDYTKVHHHWPAVYSGVFYLEIPKDYAGTLFFPDLEHHIEPIKGQLVVFSGSTRHGVETIKSNGERLAVSFNYRVG